MNARMRWGMIVGIIGLFINTFASLIFVLSGPVISFVIGIIAGFFATRQQTTYSRSEGAQQGAMTGLIAGLFILIGQIIGAVGNLIYAQMPEYESLFGSVPDLSTPEGRTFYWIFGIGVGVFFGLIDTLACILGGSIIGYLQAKRSTQG